ncbi:MAG TPA: S8 family peptidase [Solirubrobacteraceae bacterium]|nr:S8 family peptidase [Solirubrobacteraceae bacterium]
MAAIAVAAAIAAGTIPASAAALPDDPELPQPWVAQIAAEDAWRVATGDPSIVVAVVDTGVDVAHPDLAPNAWRNGGETPANGADDDGDGLVDDVAGWSFGRDSGDVADPSGHGTHVAGLIAARAGNGVGSAGVCWTCTILPVDVYREGGRGTLRDLANGMEYAAARARIVNLSLESPLSSPELAAVVTGHPDRLFVVAAGNGGRDVDASPSFPCSLDAPNLLCVAADDGGAPADGANWGAASVDLAAPGVRLVSTAPGGGTTAMTGSSFSAPLVTGTAALLWSWRPDASVAQVRSAILDGADRLPAWAGRTATGARLNAFGALRALAAARGEQPPLAGPVPAPVSVSASSSSPVAPPAPLAIPAPRATLRRGILTVRLYCRSRTRDCGGRARALGRARRFSIAPGRARAVRFAARAARRSVRVSVMAGGRLRAWRVRVGR